ncbi:MAG: biotin transporter BioY [Holosporales bacterium]|jgi:biotin transport system substrate-specific component|nr:biotin transporter BioY [Holosporales bacterium]
MGRIVTRQVKTCLSDIVCVVVGSLLIGLSAQVTVPMIPVPMTMQVYTVLMVGGVLGAKRGFAAVALYLAEGAFGLPVFSNGTGGLCVFLSPRAGYLLGMPISAFIVGYLTENWQNKSFSEHVIVGLLGLVPIDTFGILFLGLALKDFFQALAVGLYPFIVVDAFKVLLFAGSLKAFRR